MSMTDCIKCWDTPCTCGYDYRNWDVKRLKSIIDVMQKVLDEKILSGESVESTPTLYEKLCIRTIEEAIEASKV